MMMQNNDRTMVFLSIVQQMQACELLDMDYEIKRHTSDYGLIEYEMIVPDKQIAEMIKRPSAKVERVKPQPTDIQRVMRTMFGDQFDEKPNA
jgi:hypothetical protein